jgi:hypothetical protein
VFSCCINFALPFKKVPATCSTHFPPSFSHLLVHDNRPNAEPERFFISFKKARGVSFNARFTIPSSRAQKMRRKLSDLLAIAVGDARVRYPTDPKNRTTPALHTF